MTDFVICPRTIPQVGKTYEGSFVFHFLRQSNIKAITPNECWSSLKFKILNKYVERFDVAIAQKKRVRNLQDLGVG